MAGTRSRNTSDYNMSVSKEIQLYFESLIKPMATNEGMHQLLENEQVFIASVFKYKQFHIYFKLCSVNFCC